MQADAFDAVLDFDCDHPYPRAAFHVLVDCFNVQLSMVAMVLYRNQNTNSSSKAIRTVAIMFPEEMPRPQVHGVGLSYIQGTWNHADVRQQQGPWIRPISKVRCSPLLIAKHRLHSRISIMVCRSRQSSKFSMFNRRPPVCSNCSTHLSQGEQ
jgi:hypothetical protein